VNSTRLSKKNLFGGIVGGVLGGLAVAAVGFFAYRYQHRAADQLMESSGDATTAEAPVVATPDPLQPPKPKAIPDTLPDITLADRDGKPTKLASFGGRPLMVNFWATWCAPCRREIPLLNKIRAERKPQNAEIVGIAVDFKEDVAKFLQKTPLNYPLLIGEEDGLAAAEAFGMGMAFPFSVFVDSQNRILTLKVGELHEDEANFAFDRLLDIDRGVMTRQAAQAAVADAFRTMAANRALAGTDSAEASAR
jgi:thiol-disulfide isomerase/thioredoxin